MIRFHQPPTASSVSFVVPIKYDQLQGLEQRTLQARIAVLKLFADLFIDVLPFMEVLTAPPSQPDSPIEQCRNILRQIIPFDRKDTAISAVIKATMNTSGDYGPEVR